MLTGQQSSDIFMRRCESTSDEANKYGPFFKKSHTHMNTVYGADDFVYLIYGS